MMFQPESRGSAHGLMNAVIRRMRYGSSQMSRPSAGIASTDANAVLVATGVSLVMAVKLRLVCTYFLELHEAHPRIRRAVLAFCHGMPILDILTTAFGDTLSRLTGALLG